jgi:XisH protein
MPTRDIYHTPIRNALAKDGWTITHDPYRIKLRRGKNLFIDLGAERLIAAQRSGQTIAVEIKSFRSASDMKDLEEALGQFTLYRQLLKRYDPGRTLYLAVPDNVRRSVFEEEAGQILIEDGFLQVISVDIDREVIVSWIPELCATPPKLS